MQGFLKKKGHIKVELGPHKSKKTNEYIGIDIINHPGVDIIHDLLTGIPFPDNSVDEVYSSNFMEHFNAEQVDFLMREQARVLKPGGVLRIKTPHFSSFGAFHEHHKVFYRFHSLRDYFDAPYSGWEPVYKLRKREFIMLGQNVIPGAFLVAKFFSKFPRLFELWFLKILWPAHSMYFEFEKLPVKDPHKRILWRK